MCMNGWVREKQEGEEGEGVERGGEAGEGGRREVGRGRERQRYRQTDILTWNNNFIILHVSELKSQRS